MDKFSAWSEQPFGYAGIGLGMDNGSAILFMICGLCVALALFMAGYVMGVIKERLRPWSDHLYMPPPVKKGRFK